MACICHEHFAIASFYMFDIPFNCIFLIFATTQISLWPSEVLGKSHATLRKVL